MPILAEYKSKQGEDATRVFVSYVSGLLTRPGDRHRYRDAGGAVGDHHHRPGFADTADKFALTTQLLRITFPIFC